MTGNFSLFVIARNEVTKQSFIKNLKFLLQAQIASTEN